MTNEQFEQYYPRYQKVICAIARKVAQHNTAAYDELVQAGCIALWQCDPAKATDNEDAFIRQAIKYRMIDTMRQLNPKRWRSLDQALAGGCQLALDADGDLCLLTSTLKPASGAHVESSGGDLTIGLGDVDAHRRSDAWMDQAAEGGLPDEIALDGLDG